MLKRRILASLVVRGGIVVQSFGFGRYLPVGRPEIAAEFLDRWGIDEIVLTDIDATRERRGIDAALVRRVSGVSRAPLTVGGGIASVDNIDRLLLSGADKVVLNQAAFSNPDLVTAASRRYGRQCVVASIDAVPHPSGNGGYLAYDYLARTPRQESPDDLARRLESAGAGEIFINSVERDGSKAGYDLELVRRVAAAVSVPVIACGGARHGGDMEALLRETPASAACAANFFHFQEHAVNLVKRHLTDQGHAIRLDTPADYAGTRLGSDLRPLKKDDATLERMLFVRIEKEVI